MADQNPRDFSQQIDDLARLNRELEKSETAYTQILRDLEAVTEATARSAQKTYTKVKNLAEEALAITARMQEDGKYTVKVENTLAAIKAEQLVVAAKLKALNEGRLKDSIAEYENEEANLKSIQERLEAEKTLSEFTKQKIKEESDLVEKRRMMGQNLARFNRIEDLKDLEVASILELEGIKKRNKAELESYHFLQRQEKELAKLKADFDKIEAASTKREEVAEKEKQKKGFYPELLKRAGLTVPGRSASDIERFGGMKAGALAVVGGVAALIKFIVESMFKADQLSTDFARNMTITKEESRSILRNFELISSQAGNLIFTSADIAKSQMEINKSLGTSMYMRANDLLTLTKSRELLGLSEDAMAGMAKFSFVTGKSFESIKNEAFGASKAIQVQTGLFFQDKDILEKTLKITGGMRTNFKGNAAAIAESITLAKTLGTTLELTQKTSENLLNFEQSISSELEAELLTGQRLNLERARSAALMGDMNTVMQEMNKQGITFDKFANMNVIAQEKLAGAFGLSRDEYSDMLFEQTALNKMRALGISADQKNLIENFNKMKAAGQDVVKILGAQVAERLEIQSGQEKLTKFIEKLQTVFQRFVDSGLLDSLMVRLANVAKYFAEGGSVLGAMMPWGRGFSPENPYTAEDLLGKTATGANNSATAQQSASQQTSQNYNITLMVDSMKLATIHNMNARQGQ